MNLLKYFLLGTLVSMLPGAASAAGESRKGTAPAILNSFDPAETPGLTAIAYDAATGKLYLHATFGQIFPFTKAGVAAGAPFDTPGNSSNDIDLDFAPVNLSIGGVAVAQDTLLVANGESNPEIFAAVDKADGTLLASVDLPVEISQTVGASWHASRNSLFVVDWSSDQIVEVNAADGSLLNAFPVTPTGSPPFDVFFGDIEVKQNTGTLLIVSSSSAGRMREMSPTGEFLRDIDLSAGGTSWSGIAYDDETGEFFLSDTGGTVVHFAPIGSEQNVPDPPGSAAGDVFGSAVAVDGNLMVVGLPGADGGAVDEGAIAIYRIEGGGPVFEQLISVPPEFVATGFGAAVAVSGDTIVAGTAGAPVQKGLAAALAAAILQRTAGGGPFSFRQALTGNGMSSGSDRFGSSVSISGNAVVVGAPDDDESEGSGQGSGAAYVFNRTNDSVNFDVPVKLKPTVADPRARFGAAVAVRNNKIAVGAPDSKPNGVAATGSASMYSALSGIVSSLGSITGTGSGAGARFGAAVAVDRNGIVAITAPQESASGQSPTGAAYLVDTSGSVPTQSSRLEPEDPVSDGQFGAAVAIDNGNLIVGSPGAENGGERSGAVYRFKRSGGSVLQISRTAPFPGQVGLGASVAISADRVLSGAPQSESSLGSALLQLDTGRIFISGFE